MSEKQRYVIAHAQARQRAQDAVRLAPDGWEVIVKPPARRLGANKLMWKWLAAYAQQCKWPVNGAMVYMEDEDWKNVFSAALVRETRMAAGMNGGVVLLGQRTRKFSVAQMNDMITLMEAEAPNRGVRLGGVAE